MHTHPQVPSAFVQFAQASATEVRTVLKEKWTPLAAEIMAASLKPLMLASSQFTLASHVCVCFQDPRKAIIY